MASTSALLKSAQATQQKIQSANDAQVAYEWENSAQTYDDYLAYSGYLQAQSAKTTDPTQTLSYDTKLRGAFSSYSSNEIQRQSQAIAEGNQTTQGKMQVVENLYNQAVALGNNNLAQNLVGTYDSLSVQLQNEAKTAYSAAVASSSAAATALKAQISDTIDSYKNLKDQLVSTINSAGNPKEAAQSIAAINAQLPPEQQIPEGAGIFDVAAGYVNTVNSLYQQARDLSPDEKIKNDYTKAANDFNKSTVLELPSVSGSDSIKLNPQELQKEIALQNVGQTMFEQHRTAEGLTFTQNKVDNYQFGHDANGNVVAIPTYSPQGMDLGAKVTDLNGDAIKESTGKKQATYVDLLKQAGFSVDTKGGNGSFLIQDTTGQNRLNGADSAQVFLTADGKLQFVGTPSGQADPNNVFQDNPIFNFGFDSKGKFTGISKDVANPGLVQYSPDYKGNDTAYFNAHPQEAQQAYGTAGLYTHQTIGQFDQGVGLGGMPTVAGAGTIGGAPRFSSPTSLLQGAANISAANQARTAALQGGPAQIASAPAIQLQAPSLGQSILQNQQNAKISIAPVAAPTANISIKPVKPTGTFTGVSNKNTTGNITF